MRKAATAVVTAALVGIAGGLAAGQPATSSYRYEIAPKVVKQRVQKEALRYAKQYVVLRHRGQSRAEANRELTLTLSVRAPHQHGHSYVSTLSARGARAVISVEPGDSMAGRGRAVHDRGPTACATITLKRLDRGQARVKAVRTRLGQVAGGRSRCVRHRG